MRRGTVRLKTADEIKRIREAGIINGEIFRLFAAWDLTGETTWEIDSFIDDFIVKKKARAAFKTLRNYDFASCISLNDEIIHGIPSRKRKVKKGDLVKIDIGIVLNGYFSDSCATFAAGDIGEEKIRLVKTARKALEAGIGSAQPGNFTGDIGKAVQDYAEGMGYLVVKEFSGHGTGFSLHEPPSVPSFGPGGNGYRLREGLVIAVEPAINQGSGRAEMSDNGWTLVTEDGKLSAQFEHTIAVTKEGPVVLTG